MRIAYEPPSSTYAKAGALTTNFAGQWLYLRNLKNMQPNSFEFPDFDDNLRQAFRRETDAARHRVEQPGGIGAHVPRDRLPVAGRLDAIVLVEVVATRG